MNVKDIKIGMRLKIVGTKGGCYDTRCKNCTPFDKGIKVTEVNYDRYSVSPIAKVVSAKCFNFNNEDPYLNHNCSFHPDDLAEIEIKSWRKEIDK